MARASTAVEIEQLRAENKQLRAELKQLRAELKQLRAENEQLRELVEKLGATVNEQAKVIEELKRENAQLRLENEQLKRRLLGPTSEKMPSVSTELRRRDKKRRGKDSKRKGRPGKTAKAMKPLETERKEHRVPDEQRTCPNCPGVELQSLGIESLTEYEFVPARFVRRFHEREKLCCPSCKEHIVTAPAPLKVHDKAQYGPGFFAHLVVAKCADAIPLYRQAKALRRIGIPMARSTMTDLFHRTAELLRPLVERMFQIIRQATHVQGDETSFRILDTGKCRRGFIWAFIGAGLIAYRYSSDRSGETPNRELGGTNGKLLVDGYTGYNQVCDVDGRERAGCLAHCRRYFFDASSNAPAESQHVLERILDVYAVEHKAAELDIVGTDEHLARRRTESKPIMDQLHEWLIEQQPLHPPQSPIAKAIGYAVNQWKHLTLFLDDPKLPVDNNESERRLRLIALGRKNYLFAVDDAGAENLATLMSLVVTCEAHGINPEEYIADILLRIQLHPNNRIDDLLPPMWQTLRDAGTLTPLDSS